MEHKEPDTEREDRLFNLLEKEMEKDERIMRLFMVNITAAEIALEK